MNKIIHMKRFGIFIILITFSVLSLGQSIFSIADGTINTCNGVVFDTGGQGASGYQNGENFTVVICPDIPGDVITLVFNNFALNTTNTATPPQNNADNISIYDGNSVGAPTLGTYTGNQLQGNIVTTTSLNTSGCITLVFNSNSAGTGTFSATITCTTPCQAPTALMASPTVPQNPQKICVGETINFDASGSSAMPGFTLTDYIFDFGDGTVDTVQTPIISHAFTNGPGEYLVTLNVIDDNGCINTNSEIIIVWVSTTPQFNTVIPDSALCLGESTCLDGSFVQPVMYTPSPNSSLTGTTYLPDDPGACFTATLNYGFFTPGQTLNNINDLLGICVTMEHSYMGDLVATIICPNGQSVVMHQQGTGGTNLGDPNQADDSLLVGTGWDYCWSPQATNGTWVDNATGGITPNTMTNSSGSQSLIPGDYESLNPLDSLVGCPLNGVWTLEFCDLWGADDGFVFDLSIELDTSLYPSLTTFTPSIGLDGDSTFWSASGIASTFITSYSADSNVICINPTDTGSFDYTFTAIDDFGCSYDTTVTISVYPGPEVDAGNDTTVCIGSTAQLNAGAVNAGPTTCNYTLDMYDTFGDGWNGFGVDIIINGSSIGIQTFTTGSSASITFAVTVGDVISWNTISGVFDSEVSYEILDCLGNVVFNDGVNYTGGNPNIGVNIFNTIGTGTSPTYSFQWTPSTGLSNDTIADPIVTVNADMIYVVEMWEPGHQACSSFDTVNVFINPVAFAGVDSTDTICPALPPFDMFTYLGVNADTTGSWFDNGAPTSNMFDPQTATPGSTYLYTYLINDPTCPDSATVEITMITAPLVNAGNDTTICEGGTVLLNAVPNGGATYNYNWTPPTGLSNVSINNPIASNLTADITYIVEIWDVNTPTCTSFDTINIIVNPMVYAGIDSTVTICPGTPSFDLTPFLGNSPDPNGSWFENGNPSSNIFDPTTTPSGTYIYTYIVSSPTCPDTASISVIVRPLGDILCDCPLNGSDSIVDVSCFGDCNGEIIISDSLGTAIDYSLDGLTWQTDSVFQNLCFGNYTVYTQNLSYGPTCKDTINITIQTPAELVINLVTNIDETCYNQCDGEINITAAPKVFSYSINNGTTTQDSSRFVNLCTGSYNILVTDSAGCVATNNISVGGPIEVIPSFGVSPQPTFSPNTEITFTDQSQGATSYLWDIVGIDTFTTSNLVYKFPEEAGTYQVCLHIENNNGCPADLCQIVTIKEDMDIFIPNTFTPDFNGLNEVFKPIIKLKLVVDYNLQIYNRWGELLFETSDPEQGWNGDYGGTLVKTGVYVYKIKMLDTNNLFHNKIGSVNVIY
jgi:gliding motility-associated-like protein